MSTTLSQVAGLVDGELFGDGNIRISGAAIIRDAQPGQITLVDGATLLDRIGDCPASAVIVPRGMQQNRIPQVAVDDVHVAFARVVTHFQPQQHPRRAGVSPAAWVSPSAGIGADVSIHPGATIEDDVEIGDRSEIHSGVRLMSGCKLAEDVVVFPNAVLYENTVVGPRVIIHGGAIIGAYGFGYKMVDGRHEPSAQLGNVEIEADVEIGAGTTIDRGTYGETRIGEGTKIDNQVMIAHNCRIGRHNILCSQVGIAGSCVTGDYVVMAGQVGLRDHLRIGDGASLGAQSGHIADGPPGGRVVGSPAIPEREFWQMMAVTRKLPELRRTLKRLERQLSRNGEPLDLPAQRPPRQRQPSG